MTRRDSDAVVQTLSAFELSLGAAHATVILLTARTLASLIMPPYSVVCPSLDTCLPSRSLISGQLVTQSSASSELQEVQAASRHPELRTQQERIFQL